jgi:DNA-directed RNA polymerase subunit M/transcription elongation factor TFIIS
MTINPDDCTSHEDAPNTEDKPACPQCQSTDVKFITFTTFEDKLVQLYLCNVCGHTFFVPMPEIPF